MKFHELANIFPMLEGEHINKLAEDIKAYGLREKIVIYENAILDGRNRYAACVAAGVEPQYTQYTGSDPLAFVISANLHRRHLDASQRAMIAAKLANIHNGEFHGNQYKVVTANLQSPTIDQTRAAKMLNVSPRSVADAVRVREQADPETVKRVESGELAVSKVVRDFKRADRVEHITRGNRELQTEKLYPVVYADPPWAYEFAQSDSREIENQYPTMSIDEICALPIDRVAAQDCVLFLWATSPKLREALRVIESWGFEYRTCMVWVKDKIGMGYYARQRHELLLIATRGNIPTPLPNHRPDSIISAPRLEHSAKPSEVYGIIEQMYPEYERIELFARNRRADWDAWGNQA